MRKLRRLWDWLLPGLIYLDPMVLASARSSDVRPGSGRARL
jgi:hypothetical protein